MTRSRPCGTSLPGLGSQPLWLCSFGIGGPAGRERSCAFATATLGATDSHPPCASSETGATATSATAVPDATSARAWRSSWRIRSPAVAVTITVSITVSLRKAPAIAGPRHLHATAGTRRACAACVRPGMERQSLRTMSALASRAARTIPPFPVGIAAASAAFAWGAGVRLAFVVAPPTCAATAGGAGCGDCGRHVDIAAGAACRCAPCTTTGL